MWELNSIKIWEIIMLRSLYLTQNYTQIRAKIQYILSNDSSEFSLRLIKLSWIINKRILTRELNELSLILN